MFGASRNPEVVVLVGAGASVKLRIPAMKGMMQMYRKEVRHGRQVKRALEHLDAIKLIQDVEEMLLTIERVIDFPKTTNYELVKRVIAPSNGEGAPARLPYRFGSLKRDMQVLKNNLLAWIATTCFQFDRDEAERIWGDLCKVLADRAYPIFTTNYDFAIEQTAEAKDLTVVDNFKATRNRSFWDQSLSSFSNVGLRVVKLHGSVNWYMAEGKKTIEKLHADAPKRNLEGIPLERVVIFPTQFKDIYETHYFALYMMFLETLRAAKVLIVIGHSLRDEYIRAAIRESFRNAEFHLVVVSPNFPTQLDIRKVGGRAASRTTHVALRFEEFSSALAYILQDVVPSEVPKKCAEIVHFRKRRRKSRISFDKPPRSIVKGESFERTVRIEALALPRAEVVVTIQDLVDPKVPPRNLHTIEKPSGKPLAIRGVAKIERKVSIQVPKEVPSGKKKMILALKQEDGAIIAEKEYTSNIKQLSQRVAMTGRKQVPSK